MKTVYYLIALLFISQQANAQLDKLKNKLNKTDNSKTEKVEEPKKESPAAKEISDFKREAPTVKYNIEKERYGVQGGLNMLNDLLSKIKSKDPNNAELPGLEKQYNELVKQYETNRGAANDEAVLEDMNIGAMGLTNSMSKWSDLSKYGPRLDYATYLKQREKVISTSKDGADNYYVKKLDVFFKESYPTKIVPDYKETVEGKLKEIERLYVSDAPEMLTRLKSIEEKLTLASTISPENAEIKNMQTQVGTWTSKVDTYIKSGEYDKWVEKNKQAKLDAVKLEPARMTDANVTNLVKSKMNKAVYGEPIKINIVSSSWEINQNDLGIATDKNVKVQIATKLDGKCYLHHLWVRKDHKGGGQYGEMYLDESEYLEEMNCANVK